MASDDPLLTRYVSRCPGSAALHQRAARMFAADGATHFTRVRAPFRPYIDRALGSRKWDVDGNEYVDYVMGHGALILGHGHPAVVEAIATQVARGLHYGDNHALELDWAELIAELMPSAERVEYFASGQEANQMAIRLARVFTGRRRILRFRFNYHGWGDELTAPSAAGVIADHVTVIPADDVAVAEQHLATGEYAVALIEAGGGTLSGRVPTSPEFYQALPELTRRHGTVLLLDEVVTGFRDAPGGWQSVVGIRPDLTTVGKAVSGGMPSGGVLGRADIMAALGPSTPAHRLVAHGGTWNALPPTCAAGIAACREYRGGQPQRRAAEMAALLRERANAALDRVGVAGRLFGRSIVHLYFGPVDAAPRDGSAPSSDPARLVNPAAAPVHKRLDLHLLARGVASMRGEAFILSAAHTEADIEYTVGALEASLAAMLDERSLDPSYLGMTGSTM